MLSVAVVQAAHQAATSTALPDDLLPTGSQTLWITALAAVITAVATLLQRYFAGRKELLEVQVKTGDGELKAAVAVLKAQLEARDVQITELKAYVARLEARLWDSGTRQSP